jgi:hypothetical protein
MSILNNNNNEITTRFLFGRINYILMFAGIGLIVLGFILMSGGNNPDPNVFDESLVYSPMRITVAPILVLSGFVVEIFAILIKPKN